VTVTLSHSTSFGTPKRLLLIATVLGIALNALPLVWYQERISPFIDAPGIAMSRFVVGHLFGATDQLRFIDFAAYLVAGSLFWSALLAILALAIRHAARTHSPAT
jgi:hypothetical protein